MNNIIPPTHLSSTAKTFEIDIKNLSVEKLNTYKFISNKNNKLLLSLINKLDTDNKKLTLEFFESVKFKNIYISSFIGRILNLKQIGLDFNIFTDKDIKGNDYNDLVSLIFIISEKNNSKYEEIKRDIKDISERCDSLRKFDKYHIMNFMENESEKQIDAFTLSYKAFASFVKFYL